MGDDLPYDSRATYELFSLAQVLDPAYTIQADVNQDTLVELVAACIPALGGLS